mgnify:CR=1 FL=1
MPTRDEAPLGAPIWVDLFTSDPDASRAFYEQLFGWTSEAAGEEFGGYINFAKDGRRVAGAMRNDGSSGQPDGWNTYLASADAAATDAAVQAAGGQVIVPAMDVMDLGAMAVYADPTGASIGAWRPGTHRGFEVLGEAGAPSWFELHTRGYDAAVAFYRAAFGWDTHSISDVPEFRYTTLGEGEDQLAGIMDASGFLPEGAGSRWELYFGTTDTDATVAKAVELGATVTQPAEDTPYGRLAALTDCTGAAFRLVSTPG